MELCLYTKPRMLGTETCTHPLPCPEHGSRMEPVAVALSEYAWRVDALATGGRMISLIRGDETVGVRLVSAAALDDEPMIRESMLSGADLMPRRIEGRVLIGAMG